MDYRPRLMTRLLNGDKLCSTLSKLFMVGRRDETPCSSSTIAHLSDALNNYREMEPLDSASEVMLAEEEVETSFTGVSSTQSTAIPPPNRSPTCCDVKEEEGKGALNPGGFKWQLWQTGIEVKAMGRSIFSLKQFLPLAHVSDVNYSLHKLHRRSDTGWRPLQPNANDFLIEFLLPDTQWEIQCQGDLYWVEVDRTMAIRLLSAVFSIVDDLLEDWFPALGSRFIQTSQGRLLVDRLIPCHHCANQKEGRGDVYLFSVEECILEARTGEGLLCPNHGAGAVELLAPDVVFGDLGGGGSGGGDCMVSAENIRRGKLVGRGAFGFVFNGYVRHRGNSSGGGSSSSEAMVEVALKVLEPIPAISNSNAAANFGSAQAAIEAFALKWRNDALENATRSYIVARQELSMLLELCHQPHITLLLGFSLHPMTIIIEYAPHGALNTMLAKYRRSKCRLPLGVLQQTCVQIAKALEHIHSAHIIFRDLKSENVLLWRFPAPHQPSASDVLVKLGDYGIARSSCPSTGVCKGYGGTEGFMAMEIMRWNGEQEYTNRADCYSFGMLIYELISLKQPYDGCEQMKDFILEGRKPFISEKELLLPSNVLDLMVTCWSDTPDCRPSSSQLVRICSAPEFTHLLDIALLREEGEVVGSGSNDPPPLIACLINQSSNEGSPAMLLCQSGRLALLTCSRYGWTDMKVIDQLGNSNHKEREHVTALCEVPGERNTLWMGHESGSLLILCPSTFAQLAEISTEEEGAQGGIRLLEIIADRQLVLVGKHHSLLLYHPDSSAIHLVTRIELQGGDEIFDVTFFPTPMGGDWQIWSAHSHGRIFIHHISPSNTLIFSASTSHHQPARAATVGRVKRLLASHNTIGRVWSALEEDSRIFCWWNGKVRKTLACGKILPVSESLSSMCMDGGLHVSITAIELLSGVGSEQLLIGTNPGVLVIIEAGEVERILCCDPRVVRARNSSEEMTGVRHSDFSHLLGGEATPPSIAASSSTSNYSLSTADPDKRNSPHPHHRKWSDFPSGWQMSKKAAAPARPDDSLLNVKSGVGLYEAMARGLKSTFISGETNTASQRVLPTGDPPYFITLGRGYRPLLNRFGSSADVASSISNTTERCAIFWRADSWDTRS